MFDSEKNSVLHAEMAKKNLFIKRGSIFFLNCDILKVYCFMTDILVDGYVHFAHVNCCLLLEM